MRNLLVTGANGQLGRSFQKIQQAYPQHVFFFTDIPEMDITDRNQVDAFIKKNQIQILVNCAAYTAVDKAEKEPELADKINYRGVEILAEVARKNEIPLVHVSTDYVFDGETCHPLKETDDVNPIGIYGKTKWEGEQAIQKIGCNAVVVRTAWLYSEFGGNFVKTMLRLGCEKESISVVYDQVGTPTYAADLAKAILKIIEKGIYGYSVYHFSNEGAISWYDFAKEIIALSGMHTKVLAIESHQFPSSVKRPAYSVLSKDKVKAIGVQVPYWKDSLQHCLTQISPEK